MNRLWSCFALLVALMPVGTVWGQRREPLEPSASLEKIVLEPGFTAQLLAHEPQTVDPVEVAFDDAGRMWVVEMRDYPYRTAPKPRGRIVVLTDTNLDGIYETSQTYADGLEMPNGIAFWKQGIVATLAGKLVYLPDADRDLKADSIEVWLEGFKEDNEQLRANHPRLGPDGWWYIACGLRGGAVKLGKDMQTNSQSPPLEIGSRDVRFNLRNKSIELITGPAQFGLTFDAIGNRLFCSNRNPATQVVLEQADLEGNPLSGIAPSVTDVIAAGEASHVFPLVNAWTTSHLHSGQFTAACGVYVRHRGELQAEVFACEPTGSLVRRQVSHLNGTVLIPDSPVDGTAAPEREWLASRDEWFRPVNVTVAPDGELVVVDMHRAVIEHPQFVPEELKKRPDQLWGDQAGRIIWVGSQASKMRDVVRDLQTKPLGTRSDDELTQLVSNPNPWLRQTATRLLVEREATSAIDALQRQAMDSARPVVGRLAALQLSSVLSDLKGSEKSSLKIADLITANLSTAKEQALAIVALRISRHQPSLLDGLQSRLVELAVAASDRGVRFEAWLTLGALAAIDKWSATPAVIDSAAQSWIESADRYQLIAMASAFRDQPHLLMHSWLQSVHSAENLNEAVSGQIADVARGLTQAVIRGELLDKLNLEHVLQLITPIAERLPSRGELAAQLGALVCLEQLIKRAEFKAHLQAKQWDELKRISQSNDLPTANRVAAIGILSQSPRPEDAETLGEMVRDNTVPELVGPLLVAWSAASGEQPNRYLLESLKVASPQLQRVILPLLASNPKRLELLTESLEGGVINPRQIGAAELTKLVGRATGAIKDRLKSQLDRISNTNRAEVIAKYKDCLSIPSDAKRGMEVFRKHCASCHRIGEIGVDVGPNISDSRTKQPLELLTSILDPNLAIDNNYFRFTVLTEDGRVVEGIIAEETSDAVVLRGQDNRRERISRDEIAEIKASGVSLMPEGVESQIDPQSMADLIAFIKGWRYLDGAIPSR